MMLDIRIWTILLACLCASIEGYRQETMAENFPGYAVTAAIDGLNSSRCRKEMEEYRDAVDRRALWSMKMFDSSGWPSSGFISGNNYWMGNKYECENLNQKLMPEMSIYMMMKNPIYNKMPEPFAPFEVNFFGAHIRHNSSFQYHMGTKKEDIIVLGICLPASCTEQEVSTMLQKVFDDELLSVAHFFEMDFELIRLSNLQDNHLWLREGRVIISMIILAIVIGTVIAGTLYDCLVHQGRLRKRQEFLVFENNNTTELKNGGDMEEKRDHARENSTHSELEPNSRIEQILMYFSAYTNIQQIFNVENSTDEIAQFHGMKFIGMICIISGHTIYYSLNIIGNKADGYVMATKLDCQVFSAATLSVETFFFISGYLMTYSYQKAQSKEKKVTSLRRNAFNFVGAIVKRYIRITPAYVFTILLVIVSLTWEERLSLWYFFDATHDTCSKYWWRNILYINNFFHWDELCLNWSWYLSNDMQFYIFGVFLLILSSSYYYTSLAIGAVTLLLSVVWHGYITYATGYIPTLDIYHATLTHMYIRPWMRIQPYIIGMGTALVSVKLDGKLHLSKKVLTAAWCLSAFFICSVIFGLAHRQISLTLSVLYQTFSKLGYCAGLAWIAIACSTNNGGVLNKFLSLPYWIPFSRVTLCVYLLNPFLIMQMAILDNYPIHVELIFTTVLCCGITVITYLFAFVLSTIAEVPAVNFLRTLGGGNRRKK